MKKVIRKKGDTYYLLADERLETIKNERYKNSFWIECDKNGNVTDGNKDGIIDYKTLLCKIPKGKVDIDLSTLSEDCLK